MGRLYPRMRERPPEFRINPGSPLYGNLLCAVVGSGAQSDSQSVKDVSPLQRIGVRANAKWEFSPLLNRQVLRFSGSASEVSFGNYVRDVPSSQLSVVAWAHATVDALNTIAAKYKVADNQRGWLLRFDNLSTLLFTIQPSGSTYTSDYDAVASGTFNTLLHVSGVWKAGYRTSIFVNGVWKSDATTAAPSCYQSTDNLYVGRTGDRQYLTGALGDVLILSRALSDAEISALADPSNVDLRVGGVPLILPPRRRLFTTAVAAGPTFNPAWAMHCNTYIGLGRQ